MLILIAADLDAEGRTTDTRCYASPVALVADLPVYDNPETIVARFTEVRRLCRIFEDMHLAVEASVQEIPVVMLGRTAIHIRHLQGRTP